MNRLYLLLAWFVVCFATNAYGQSDSIRTEITQERPSIDSTQQINAERNESEQKRLKEFFRRSRREVTLFEIGMESSLTHSGIFLLDDPRPTIEKTSLSSLWAGVEQKLSPSWAVAGGVGWQLSPKTNQANVSGSSWLGQVGVNFYPAINKEIREGKSANNFYRQVYITGRALLPFHDQLAIQGSSPVQTITANAFRQATLLGIGIHSTRTRIYFFNSIIGVAYLFGRDEGLRSPVQLMWRFSFGLGL